MQAILRMISNEPAMFVALILALVNTFADPNQVQTDAVRQIVEAAIVLLSGLVVRQSVTPVAKLRRGDQQ